MKFVLPLQLPTFFICPFSFFFWGLVKHDHLQKVCWGLHDLKPPGSTHLVVTLGTHLLSTSEFLEARYWLTGTVSEGARIFMEWMSRCTLNRGRENLSKTGNNINKNIPALKICSTMRRGKLCVADEAWSPLLQGPESHVIGLGPYPEH